MKIINIFISVALAKWATEILELRKDLAGLLSNACKYSRGLRLSFALATPLLHYYRIQQNPLWPCKDVHASLH